MDSEFNHGSNFQEIKKRRWETFILSFQSLGIVYGRLSTAPLYVFGTIQASDVRSRETVYELFSFIFWTLTVIPLLKYAFIVMMADDNGEGGVFALYSLLCRHAKVGLVPNESVNDLSRDVDERSNNSHVEEEKVDSRAKRTIEKYKSSHYLILFLALFGSCMTIADGVLTPALSVFSAALGIGRSVAEIPYHYSSSIERADSIKKEIDRYVPVSVACAILICLFTLQHYGTHKVGFLFAPVVTIWLLLVSVLGLYNIVHYDPKIISAISPLYLINFLKKIHMRSWGLLGSILLCVAGSEAMFADLGHFSKNSIKITFVSFVYPALFLCYAGQAAFISKHLGISDDIVHISESVSNRAIRHVFRVISLFSSAVGSQATITATFSVIHQCLALGCFPRVKVVHTSDKIHGQVYVPDVNWILMILSIAVTIGFHKIQVIGCATGLAIISAMLATTCLMSLVIFFYWEKSFYTTACFFLFFGSIEFMFLWASFSNFQKGAWFLVVLSAVLMTIMISWHYGTLKKYEFDLENKVSLDWLTALTTGLGVSRVPGIGFIYTDILTGIPAFFSHFITNLPAFHQVLIFMSFKSLPVPCIPPSRRFLIGRVGSKENRVYRCIVRYGYCDQIRDTDDFEERIIRCIGEFISKEVTDVEDLSSPEGRMMVFGNSTEDNENALISVDEITEDLSPMSLTTTNSDTRRSPFNENNDLIMAAGSPTGAMRRRKVRFMLPPVSPKISGAVREELQHLVDARESGTAYFMGQSHLSTRNGSGLLKKCLVKIFAFLDKNCREKPVALNIPHAALVEVGMVYNI
ncbi:potassium transporter 1-like [Impatiens glandulifera]|uniref:potassium transporter 1-like n=1 Tax=Impatiens glandulifera TaxID=253017 RepID=UPI001FB15A30|nr:potassium transporter 1-like [Impatiens glandulifera]